MALAGMAFMYLVTNLVDTAESTTSGLESSKSKKAKEYAKYYRTDVNGDDVLDFFGVPLSKAKEVWNESTVRELLLEQFPDFDMMSETIRGQLEESEFKQFLLGKLKKIEMAYIDGTMGLDQAKRAIAKIR